MPRNGVSLPLSLAPTSSCLPKIPWTHTQLAQCIKPGNHTLQCVRYLIPKKGNTTLLSSFSKTFRALLGLLQKLEDTEMVLGALSAEHNSWPPAGQGK